MKFERRAVEGPSSITYFSGSSDCLVSIFLQVFGPMVVKWL